MSQEKQNRLENLELQLFKFTGVKRFRKAVFWLERVKHRKSNRKNENYHPFSFDIITLEKFNGFLLYNTLLHIISLLFIVAYAALSLAMGVHNTIVDIILTIFLLIDIYCIALQRNSYLKVRVFCRRYYSRSFTKHMVCNENVLQELYMNEPQKLRSDYEVVCRIKRAFEGQSNCILCISDIESLKRICECVEPIASEKNKHQIQNPAKAGIIEECNSTLGPYTALQLRVNQLQRRLGVSGRKMLDHTAIITESKECERLYRKLVPEDTVYNMCFVCFRLYEAFSGSVNRMSANES